MNEIPPGIHDLARRLIAVEARQPARHEPGAGPALRAVERLRAPLATLSGTEGCRALLMRALTLAKARAPSLSPLHIEANGSVAGTDGIDFSSSPEQAAEGAAILLAELIALLTIFVGEALTLQLVRAAWPAASLERMGTEQKETLR